MPNYVSDHTGNEIDLTVASGSTTTGIIKDFNSLSGSATSTIQVGGSITASGDISSSGTIFAQTFQSGDGPGGADIDFSDGIDVTGNITASGNISGSDIIVSNIYTDAGSQGRIQLGSSDTQFYQTIRPSADNSKKLGSSSFRWSELNVNHITASGNITSSLTTTASFGVIDLGSDGSVTHPAINFTKASAATGLLYDGTNFVWKREGSTTITFGANNLTFGGGGNSKITAVTNTSVTVKGGTTETEFNDGGMNHTGHITASGNISASGTSGVHIFGGKLGIGTNTPVYKLDVGGDIRATGDVIANRYVVSSSVTHLTQSFSSGSTIFGDSDDDTHEFTGSLSLSTSSLGLEVNSHITASGDISASGEVRSKDVSATFGMFGTGDSAGNPIARDNDLGLQVTQHGGNAQVLVERVGNAELLINTTHESADIGSRNDYPLHILHNNTDRVKIDVGGILVVGNISSSGAINTLSHITASGNISASLGSTGSLGLLQLGNNGDDFTSASLASAIAGGGGISDGDDVNFGNITSSANISASRDSTLSVGTGSIQNDLTVSGDITGSLRSTGSFGNLVAGTIIIERETDGTDRSAFAGNLYMSSNNVIKTDDSFHVANAMNINNGKFVVNNSPIGPDVTVDGDLDITSFVTASGNISSSANFETLYTGSFGRVNATTFAGDGALLTSVPDYVFEPDYVLRKLPEVEQHISKSKHLPGIPSIDDREGWANLSVSDRDMLLLEKVEELTLYVIDLQKQINELKNK